MSTEKENLTDEDLTLRALVSCQRALLGAISANVRAVSIAWVGASLLVMRLHYYQQPTEEEVQDMEVVVSEMYADVIFERIGPVEYFFSDAPTHRLEFLNRLVFLRKQ